MATNPKYPQGSDPEHDPTRQEPDRKANGPLGQGPTGAKRPVHDHAHVDFVKKGRFPWVLIAILVAIAILIALIVWLPAMPHKTPPPTAAKVPNQPIASQIQLTNMNITLAPVGGSMYLDGVLHNQGSTAITGVQVRAQFMGPQGQVLGSQIRPLAEITGQEGMRVENFTKSPIQPNEARPFRIYFDHLPQGWNHQIPQLTVTAVTGTTP